MTTNPQSALKATTVRIVVLSDTHNTNPPIPKAGLSSADIILHAGDLTNNGTLEEVKKQTSWLRRVSGCSCLECAPFYKVRQYEESTGVDDKGNGEESSVPVLFIAGNHDMCLDSASSHLNLGGTKDAQNFKKQFDRLETCKLRYLEHQSSTINLTTKKDIRRIHFSIYGSPLSPLLTASGESRFSAFTYSGNSAPSASLVEEEADTFLASIPDTTDIIVSHAPPYGLLDLDRGAKHTGCPLLWKHIQRTKPHLVVCGHRHEGRGCVKLVWGKRNGKGAEAWRWKDPGQGAKLSVVSGKADLWEPFAWDFEQGTPESHFNHSQDSALDPHKLGTMSVNCASPAEYHASSGETMGPQVNQAECLEGGERTTLVVNAAIMATSYQKGGAKRFNKPIFVDLMVPCEE